MAEDPLEARLRALPLRPPPCARTIDGDHGLEDRLRRLPLRPPPCGRPARRFRALPLLAAAAVLVMLLLWRVADGAVTGKEAPAAIATGTVAAATPVESDPCWNLAPIPGPPGLVAGPCISTADGTWRLLDHYGVEQVTWCDPERGEILAVTVPIRRSALLRCATY